MAGRLFIGASLAKGDGGDGRGKVRFMTMARHGWSVAEHAEPRPDQCISGGPH